MIKQATVDDVVKYSAQLTDMGDKFHQLANLPGTFNPPHFFETMVTLINTGLGSIWYTVDNQDKILGALGALLFPDAFTGLKFATELFWYVKESSPGSLLRLFAAYEQWIITHGAARSQLVQLVGVSPDKLADFYTRHGYKHVESVFAKNIWQ